MAKKLKIPLKDRVVEAHEGDLVLFGTKLSRNYSYSIGELKDFVTETRKGIYESRGQQKEREERTSYLEFVENLHVLDFFEFLGTSFPSMPKSQKNYARRAHTKQITELVVGQENIIDFLVNHPDQRYTGHAELILRAMNRR